MDKPERKYHFPAEHRIWAWIALLLFLGYILWLMYGGCDCAELTNGKEIKP